jgi:hypothetical protein
MMDWNSTSILHEVMLRNGDIAERALSKKDSLFVYTLLKKGVHLLAGLKMGKHMMRIEKQFGL